MKNYIYPLKGNYNNVKSFNSFLGFGIQNHKLIDFKTGTLIDFNIHFNEIYNSASQLILIDDSNRPIFYNSVENSFDSSFYDKFRVSKIEKGLIIFYIKDSIRKYGIWDVSKKSPLIEVVGSIGTYIYKTSIFGSSGCNIFSKSINSGNTIWSLDISEIAYFEHPNEILRSSLEVQQFIGVYEEILWVFMRNRTFLGIDIQKGEVLHKITHFETLSHLNQDFDPPSEDYYKEYTEVWLPLIPDANWFLDESNGKIKGLAGIQYVEIDLKKFKNIPEKKKGFLSSILGNKSSNPTTPIYVRHLFGQLKELGLQEIAARQTVINEESTEIYFFDSIKGRWGIYDTLTYSFNYVSEPVVSQEILAKRGYMGSIKEIKQGAGKVYVLDTNQTLHIFEREE